MPDNRDVLMDAADRLAQQLKYEYKGDDKYVSYNELKKIQRYFTRHSSESDAWTKLCKLLNHRDPRSRNDWRCMSEVLGNYNAKRHSNDDLGLILGWVGRLLRYYGR